MDTAALYVSMTQASLTQQANVSILKKAMDTTEENSAALIKMMERSVAPNLGKNIDVRV